MAQQLPPLPQPVSARYTTDNQTGPNWEYMVITCQPRESLKEVRRRLADHAEYGKWELRRSLIYTGGMRKYWLRRRIIKVERTL